ncbi:hypothetical protein HN51_027974 [Arachis hypogaea]
MVKTKLGIGSFKSRRSIRILKTIRNSEALLEGALEQLEKVQAHQFRVNGNSKIKRKKLNLIKSIYTSLEQLENYKNETIQVRQRMINQVRQRIFQQALQGTLGTLNSCLNSELYLRTISVNISIFGKMKDIK